MPKDPDLDDAYALQTPDDSRRLYAGWADSYDQSFAEAMDYRSPELVAKTYAERGGAGNVLDVGAGTGLGGVALRNAGIAPVHGFDISPDMLKVARGKQVYDKLILGDLTGRLDIPDQSFDGIVSAGTFTTGHVGPKAFDELLRIAKPGAQFVITIHEKHFVSQGFEDKFNSLSEQISGLMLPKVQVYGAAADGEHKADQVHLAQFQRV